MNVNKIDVLTVVTLINLIFGTVYFEPRISIVSYISLNHIIFLLMIFMSILIYKAQYIGSLVITFLLLSPIFLSITFGGDIISGTAFGIRKSIDLYLVSLFVIATLVAISNDLELNVNEIFKILIYSLLLLFAAVVVYKVAFGFFEREVKFILFGPIVFGRLMGLGLVLSLFQEGRRLKYFSIICFTLGVLISFSKGPILFTLLSVIIYLLYNKYFKYILLLAISMALFIVALNSINTYLQSIELHSLSRIIQLLIILIDGEDITSGVNYGSVGSRADMYKLTYNVIAESPYGVGLGHWGDYISVEGMVYPHNFILETYSEMGVIFGTAFVLLYIVPIFFTYINFSIVIFFLMGNQMVSGSLADSRYWLVFSVWALIIYLLGLKGRVNRQGKIMKNPYGIRDDE